MKTIYRRTIGVTVFLILIASLVFGPPHHRALMQDAPPFRNLVDLLEQAQEITGEEQSLVMGEYTWNVDDVVTQSNCVLSDFHVNAQWHVSGVSGGFTTQVPPKESVLPSETVGWPSPGPNPVAILVVDDFLGPPVDLNHLGVVIPNNGLSSAQQEAQLQADVSHGALVLHHTNELLSAADPSGNLYAMPVYVGHYAIPDVAAEIQRAIIDEYGSTFTTQFVVNMSFAVIPCAVAKDFEAVKEQYPDFNEYAGDLAQKNPWLEGELGVLHEQLLSLLTTPLDDMSLSPLESLVKNPCDVMSEDFDEYALSTYLERCAAGEVRIVFVAASGNLGLSFPFYPAAWPEVISVGASEMPHGGDVLAKTDPWMFSNDAGVFRPGAWYQLSDGHTAFDAFYVGTSFAAPVESVIDALELSH